MNPLVLYEGMTCKVCGAELYLEDEGAAVTVRCMACGPQQRILATSCGSGKRPGCGAHIFFGGASGRVPVNVVTGANHFTDCTLSRYFRKKTETTEPKTPAAPAARQGGLGL